MTLTDHPFQFFAKARCVQIAQCCPDKHIRASSVLGYHRITFRLIYVHGHARISSPMRESACVRSLVKNAGETKRTRDFPGIIKIGPGGGGGRNSSQITPHRFEWYVKVFYDLPRVGTRAPKVVEPRAALSRDSLRDESWLRMMTISMIKRRYARAPYFHEPEYSVISDPVAPATFGLNRIS